jgi:hypothetical protein
MNGKDDDNHQRYSFFLCWERNENSASSHQPRRKAINLLKPCKTLIINTLQIQKMYTKDIKKKKKKVSIWIRVIFFI